MRVVDVPEHALLGQQHSTVGGKLRRSWRELSRVDFTHQFAIQKRPSGPQIDDVVAESISDDASRNDSSFGGFVCKSVEWRIERKRRRQLFSVERPTLQSLSKARF